MGKEPQQKIREISSLLDQDFYNIRTDYSLIKGDLLQMIKNNQLNPEHYQIAMISALENIITNKDVIQMTRNWNNEVAICSSAIEAFAAKRHRQILDLYRNLEPEYEFEVTAKFKDEDKIYKHTFPIDSPITESWSRNVLLEDINFMPEPLRERKRKIELINTRNKVSYYDRGKKKKSISLDVESAYIIDFTRVKNDLRKLKKDIKYIMKKDKWATPYDRASGRSIVPEAIFYDTVDQVRSLMDDALPIEFKPEKPEKEDNSGTVYLSRYKSASNFNEINEQGEIAAEILRNSRSYYNRRGELIPAGIYDDLKQKLLVRAVIKGQTFSRMEWDIMTPLWHKWDIEEIPYEDYSRIREQELQPPKKKEEGTLILPEDRIREYLLNKLRPVLGKDNIIIYH